MIQIDQVLVRFGGVVALNDVSASFTAPVGGIIGPNGAGKTTLMNVVSGFLTSKGGRIVVDGADILRHPPHKRAHIGLRRSFQKEQIADDLTVFENVLVQLDHRIGNSAAKRAEAAHMIGIVGLTDSIDRPGAMLSGLAGRVRVSFNVAADHDFTMRSSPTEWIAPSAVGPSSFSTPD